MNSGKRSEDQEDQSLYRRESGSAENFAENNRSSRHGRNQHGKQEAFLAVFNHATSL